MPSGGLMALAGIAEGLKQGFLTYQDVKRYKDQKEFQDKQSARQDAALGLQAKEKGLIYNPDATDGTGMIGETPLYQKQQKVAEQTANTELEGGSPEALAAKDEFSSGLLGQVGLKTKVPKGIHLDPTKILPEAMKVQAAKASANVKYTNTNTKKLGDDQVKTFNNIQKDDAWKKANGEITASKKLLDLIDDAENNPQSAKSLGIYAARIATGDKRINETEIRNLGGNAGSIMERMGQFAENAKSGKITPVNAAYMRQFVNAGLPSAMAARDEVEDAHTASFARQHGLDADEASMRVLGKPTSTTRKKQSGNETSTGPVKKGGGADVISAAQAEIARRKAAKK
jgi:hypothetical protein